MVFIEENGFFCFCGAWQDAPGKWRPLAFIERAGDRQRSTMVVAAHHTPDETFPDEESATTAACDFAIAKAISGDVGV